MSSEYRPTLRSQLRALPPAAWVLFAGTFVNRFGSFVQPLLVLYLTDQGISAARAGVALGAYGVGLLFASIVGGHLADRFGRRNTIALSMFASAAAMLALSQARSYEAIVVLTVVAGFAAELYRPASHALIADLVPDHQRVIAFGVYRFAVNLGFAAGPATAGFLATRSFFYVFVGDAITSAVYGVIALAALPRGLSHNTEPERRGEAVRAALGDRRFIVFLIASMLALAVDFQAGSTVALHIRAAGFTPATYGMLMSLNGLLIVLFELAITHRLQHRNPQNVIAAGYLLSGLGFALTGLAHSVPALALTVVIWTVGEMIASPMTGAYVSSLAPDRFRGRYMGFLVFTWSLGLIVGPVAGTYLFERNSTLLWVACGVAGVLSSILACWKFSPKPQRGTEPAAQPISGASPQE